MTLLIYIFTSEPEMGDGQPVASPLKMPHCNIHEAQILWLGKLAVADVS